MLYSLTQELLTQKLGGMGGQEVCIVTVFQVILLMLKFKNNHYRKFTEFLHVLNCVGIISVLWGDFCDSISPKVH